MSTEYNILIIAKTTPNYNPRLFCQKHFWLEFSQIFVWVKLNCSAISLCLLFPSRLRLNAILGGMALRPQKWFAPKFYFLCRSNTVRAIEWYFGFYCKVVVFWDFLIRPERKRIRVAHKVHTAFQNLYAH